MRKFLSLAALATMLLSAATAEAQMKAGVDLRLAPIGTLKAQAGDLELSNDAAFSYGLVGHLDYVIAEGFQIGLMPQYALNVKGKDATGDAGSQFDLLVRFAAGMSFAPGLAGYGYVAPGYSFIFIPNASNNPAGLAVDLGLGVSYGLGADLFCTGSLGYELGFQSVDGVDFKTSYLHLDLGIGTRF